VGQSEILVSREDVKTVQEEQKVQFVFSVLSQFVPEEMLEPVLPQDGFEITVQQKIRLREICHKFKTRVVEDFGGEVEILVSENGKEKLVAHWYKPWVVLKRDLTESDPSKQFYAEIKFKWWLISEGQT
jgi:hypothetical protein